MAKKQQSMKRPPTNGNTLSGVRLMNKAVTQLRQQVKRTPKMNQKKGGKC